MNRRDFLRALGIAGSAIVVPELVGPRRRFWQVGAQLQPSSSDVAGILGPKALAHSVPIRLDVSFSQGAGHLYVVESQPGAAMEELRRYIETEIKGLRHHQQKILIINRVAEVLIEAQAEVFRV